MPYRHIVGVTTVNPDSALSLAAGTAAWMSGGAAIYLADAPEVVGISPGVGEIVVLTTLVASLAKFAFDIRVSKRQDARNATIQDGLQENYQHAMARAVTAEGKITILREEIAELIQENHDLRMERGS